jgi:hypothetical protein
MKYSLAGDLYPAAEVVWFVRKDRIAICMQIAKKSGLTKLELTSIFR